VKRVACDLQSIPLLAAPPRSGAAVLFLRYGAAAPTPLLGTAQSQYLYGASALASTSLRVRANGACRSPTGIAASAAVRWPRTVACQGS
jgi:hypothetical protein